MNLLQWVYDILFPLPAICPVCMKRQTKLMVCDTCRAEAMRIRSAQGQCQCCHSFGVYSEHCHSCRDWPCYLSGNIAAWPYQGKWQQAILDFKFHNMPWLADALVDELSVMLPREYDILVPVPLHKKRLQERGYNQSALLAGALAVKTGIPMEDCMCRVRNTPHQTGMNREQRLYNLHGAFAVKLNTDIKGKRVIIVDDVFTTGTTIRQCAETLYQAGAVEILGATLASGKGHF